MSDAFSAAEQALAVALAAEQDAMSALAAATERRRAAEAALHQAAGTAQAAALEQEQTAALRKQWDQRLADDVALLHRVGIDPTAASSDGALKAIANPVMFLRRCWRAVDGGWLDWARPAQAHTRMLAIDAGWRCCHVPALDPVSTSAALETQLRREHEGVPLPSASDLAARDTLVRSGWCPIGDQPIAETWQDPQRPFAGYMAMIPQPDGTTRRERRNDSQPVSFIDAVQVQAARDAMASGTA
jgi:hypothetical protein